MTLTLGHLSYGPPKINVIWVYSLYFKTSHPRHVFPIRWKSIWSFFCTSVHTWNLLFRYLGIKRTNWFLGIFLGKGSQAWSLLDDLCEGSMWPQYFLPINSVHAVGGGKREWSMVSTIGDFKGFFPRSLEKKHLILSVPGKTWYLLSLQLHSLSSPEGCLGPSSLILNLRFLMEQEKSTLAALNGWGRTRNCKHNTWIAFSIC